MYVCVCMYVDNFFHIAYLCSVQISKLYSVDILFHCFVMKTTYLLDIHFNNNW